MASSSYPPKDGRKSEIKKIIIGVCAMERKAHSKPMKAIMSRMRDYYKDWLDFTIFPEEVILKESVEKWPSCDCLISFHSTDFPLKKSVEYERLRRPYVLNDLNRQFDLLDRRKVFRALARAGIDHPRHCVLVRDEEGQVIGSELKEFTDHIEVNGMVFNKPFVEKPISAEDHNVYIYFPSSVGGGSQRLFRKVNDRSSWYSPVNSVRHTGSYIYEEFIPADGTDVKVYAVGPYYAHAEARKAPGLDGKVDRDADGKEIRYPVILSAREKMIARRVVLAFGQTVCGFDLLRANGRSFVCDVNGFSFVKTSTKYYEDTAKILGNMILRRLASSLSIPWHIPFQDDDPPLVSTPSGKIMELRCVIAVIRHGDRTPKQKMKMTVSDDRFFALFRKYDGTRRKEIKMKRPNQLMEVLDLIRIILAEQQSLRDQLVQRIADRMHILPGARDDEDQKWLEHELEKCEESVKNWDQMRVVLEMYGHFSGINRKVQLKYLEPKAPKVGKFERQQSSGGGGVGSSTSSSTSDLQRHLLDEQQKPKLLLILKWGGELTTAGVLQAEALGKLFRTLYPGIRRTDGRDCPEDTQGLGFLRLHSTYRHDLKIYASDEGRVQMTAAAFAKGLLALEGELTPILMQMVKSANTDGLLNDDFNARQFQNELKSYLHSALQVDRDFTPEDFQNLNPSGLRSLTNAMEFIKNPRKMCHEIAGYVQRMCEIIRWHKHQNMSSDKSRTLYLNETWELAERRWGKELREFRKKVGKSGEVDFDISKIPDIYDNIKYDMEHNPDLCINNEWEFERFYLCVKNMADIVVPQEYGISEESKLCVAQRVCSPLMSKMRNDLHRCVQNSEEGDETLTRLDPRASEGIATPMRHVRTRLYFTSESHIHTLMNLIRYGGLCAPDDKKWQRAMNFLSGVTEFNYMTQLVLMVYEDSRNDSKDDKDVTNRFHIELLFSPGLYPCFQTEKERIYESRFNSKKQQQMNQPKASTTSSKTKNLSGKSSSDASDKEVNDLDGVESSGAWTTTTSDNNSDDGKKSYTEKEAKKLSTVSHNSQVDNSCFCKKTEYEEKNNPQGTTTATTTPSDNTSAVGGGSADPVVVVGRHNDSTLSEGGDDDDVEEDDELADHSVNLVVLGEVSGKEFGDLAGHGSSHISPLRKRPTTFKRILNTSSAATDNPLTAIGENHVSNIHKEERTDHLDIPPLHVRRSGINQTIVKSMSDVACYRRRAQITSEVAAFEASISPLSPNFELDQNQTTVGHDRGEWVKDIVSNNKKDAESSGDKELKEKKTTGISRIPLATIFSRESTTELNTTISRSSSQKNLKEDGGEKTSVDCITASANAERKPSPIFTTKQDSMDNNKLAVGEQPSSASISTIRDDDSGVSAMGRRSRFPYRFKHHTVNLLSDGMENRLISTDVLMGKFMDTAKRKQANNPVVLSTAIIARSSSAPRLQTYKASDEIPVTEIRRFWPPLRSLETMHDNIAFKDLDMFLERMMKNSTPLPSPPKTPIQRENPHENKASLDSRLKDTIQKLSRIKH